MLFEQEMCGGTSRSVDETAPKTIQSDCMTFFKVVTDMQVIAEICDPSTPNLWINYIYAFAIPVDGGSMLFLSANDGYKRNESSWALVKYDIFPELVELVRDASLAASNGKNSFTNGLPKNFGGEVRIEYDSGEMIRYSDNQSPVTSKAFGRELYALFTEAMKAEKIPVPSAEKIKAVRFSEDYGEGCYTRIELEDNGDGTCVYRSKRKYDSPQVYEDEKILPDELMKLIREKADRNGMLMWDRLPANKFHFGEVKYLSFVFEDGSEVTVSNDRLLPEPMAGAFFAIELELTSK